MHDFNFLFARKVFHPALSPFCVGDLPIKLTRELSNKTGVPPTQQRQPLLVPQAPVTGGQEALVKSNHALQLCFLVVEITLPHLLQVHEDHPSVETLAK